MTTTEKGVKISLSAHVPAATEREMGAYIKYGERNLYPQWLYGLYNASGIHKGILNQKIDFVFGSGFRAKIDNENLFLFEEDAESIIEGIVKDFEVLGYSIILFEKRNNNWYIVESDSEKFRYSKNPDYLFYSEDWSKGSQRIGTDDFRHIPLAHTVDENDYECAMVVELPRKQSIEYGNESRINNISGNYYTSPSYSGAITSIMAHIEMCFYDYSEAANGFVSNTIVQLNDGKPSNETEARKVVRKLESMFQDRKKRGGITFLFNDGQDSAATINELGRSQNVGKYNETKSAIAKDIMIAHSVQNASLFGLEIEGSLGGTSAEEQLVAFEKFNKTYVLKRQKAIQKAINSAFLMLNGVKLGFEFLPFEMVQKSKIGEEAEEETLVNEEEIIEAFKKIGRPKSELKDIHFSRSSFGENNTHAVSEFIKMRKAVSFLSEDLEMIMEMVRQGLGLSEMLKKFPSDKLIKNVAKLRKLGYMDGWELTEKGRVEIAKEEDFEVLYTYEEVPGIPAVKTESREICKALMAENKYYTREEIEEIGRMFGVDNLWKYRGGWYHNPKTDLTTRHCRHEWKQHIILKNKA